MDDVYFSGALTAYRLLLTACCLPRCRCLWHHEKIPTCVFISGQGYEDKGLHEARKSGRQGAVAGDDHASKKLSGGPVCRSTGRRGSEKFYLLLPTRRCQRY